MTFSRSIHVAENGNISFFLWLSNIPLCTYTHHILNQLSVHGHLGCFHRKAFLFSANWCLKTHKTVNIRKIMSWFLLVRASQGPTSSFQRHLTSIPSLWQAGFCCSNFHTQWFPDCQECFTIWVSWLYKNPLVCPRQLWKNVFFSLYPHPSNSFLYL